MLYRFAGFTFDSDRHELHRPDGTRVPLVVRAEDLLLALLEQPRVTLSREELLERVWPGVATTGESLRRAVHLVRRALDTDNSLLVTVRGRGYRLDAAVEVGPLPEAGGTEDADGTRAMDPGASPIRWGNARRALVAIGVGAMALLLFLGRPIAVETPALEPRQAPAARPLTSLAVLRFADLTEGAPYAHVAEGLSEELIHRLAQVPELHVIGRTSSFAIPPGSAMGHVGERLGVGSVVQGSLRRRGERFRVSIRLARVVDGADVWSREFEIDSLGLPALRDDIAAEIAAALAGAVDGISPLRLRLTRLPDPRAYDHFLRGTTARHFRNPETAARVVEHFERAVALDPDFAEAWAGLSRALGMFSFYARGDAARYESIRRRADEAAYRALELDPSSGLAHGAVSQVLIRRSDLVGAAERLRVAIDLAPGVADLLEDYAMALVQLGRPEEAREPLLRLVERDPLSPVAHRQLGRVYVYLDDPELAIRSLRRALELNPYDEDAPRLLAEAYRAEGRELEAGEVFIRRYPWFLRGPARAGLRVLGMQTMGRVAYELSRWRTGDRCLNLPYDAAGLLAVAGDGDGVFACLERAPITMLSYFNVEPVFAPYRDDPRFAHLLQRAGKGTLQAPLHRSAPAGVGVGG